MKTNQRITVGSLFLGCALGIHPVSQATAQSADPDIAEFAKSLPQDVLCDIARPPQQYLQQMSQRIFSLSPDGIATLAAAELSANRNIANARASAITQILRYDLDGDGTVTARN